MAAFTEVQGILTRAGSVTLDANGTGSIYFDPANARQRWEVESVVAFTNQDATATVVPVVQLYLNGNTSLGNSQGASWNGNQVTFSGTIKVGPCDTLYVYFSPPTGTSGSSLSGVNAYANISGTYFTRRS